MGWCGGGRGIQACWALEKVWLFLVGSNFWIKEVLFRVSTLQLLTLFCFWHILFYVSLNYQSPPRQQLILRSKIFGMKLFYVKRWVVCLRVLKKDMIRQLGWPFSFLFYCDAGMLRGSDCICKIVKRVWLVLVSVGMLGLATLRVRVTVCESVGLGDTSVWVWWCACITKRWIVVIMEAASHTHKFYSCGHTFCIISTSQNWILILNSQIFIIALPSPNLSLLLFTVKFCLFIPLLPFGSSVQALCIFSFLFKIINSCYVLIFTLIEGRLLW